MPTSTCVEPLLSEHSSTEIFFFVASFLPLVVMVHYFYSYIFFFSLLVFFSHIGRVFCFVPFVLEAARFWVNINE